MAGSLRLLWPLAAILPVGAALRWFSAGRIALWRDEAQYVAIASLPDPGAIVSFLYHHESHPPLYYLIGYAGRAMFGSVEGSMGALAFICSVATIAVVYFMAAAAFSRTAAVIAASGTALSIPLTLYSVQIRPYGLLSLLLLVSHAGLWMYWSRRSQGWLLVWAVGSMAALYTHYLSVLVLAGQVLVAGWLQWRASPLPERDLRRLGIHAAVVFVAFLPGLWLLAHQANSTAYPATRPLRIEGPPLTLASLSMSFPLEVLLPIVMGLAILVALARRSHLSIVRDAGVLLVAPAPVFLVLAVLATYRSQFLTPHVLLVLAPFSMLLFGGFVTTLFRAGRKWRAAIWFEVGMCLALLSGLVTAGFTKTTVDLIAASVAAEASQSDLVLLVPGAIGASFNRYFGRGNSQINFPYAGRIDLYPFDSDFKHMANPEALKETQDSLSAAYGAGRRVWFIADSRWIRADLAAPLVLPRDSFGGIGQSERARVNRIDRYLRWLYGQPIRQLLAGPAGRGHEHVSAWLFERVDSLAADSQLTQAAR